MIQLKTISALCFALAVIVRAGPGATSAAQPVVSVVCTTTHLSAVIEAVGRDLVETRTIVPFGMCPGHFDVSPGEADRIRRADIVLAHGFERFLDGFAGTGRTVRLIEIEGNWMIPEIHKKAAREIAELLSAARPEMRKRFLQNLAEYEEQIDIAARNLQDSLRAARGTAVVCAEMISCLAEWMGMNVAATMPRDEEISVKSMHEIILRARRSNVKLVLDNRQSSGKVGETIARNANVPLIVLSNFPEASRTLAPRFPYIETLEKNYASVRAALE